VRPKYFILAFLTLLVFALDQLTKRAILLSFHLGETKPILSGFFNLTYVRNTGAAFGILHDANPTFRIPFFILVPIAALGAIALVFRKLPKNDWKLSSALSMVIGGAIGNLVDRLQLGYVVDFLDFHWNYGYHFPAFNVADSAICVGVAILITDLVLQDTPDDVKSEVKPEVKINASTPP
jgi:signal peptidase II